MCRYSKNKGRYVGVLNDFDLSLWTSKKITDHIHKHRTGTKPFMAIDLLRPDPPIHLYRHDLESLFYVMTWHSCRYQDGKLIENPPFEDWAGDHIEALRKNKNSFMARGNNITPTPQHKPLFRLMVKLKEALHNGVIACEATGDDGEIAELSPKDHLTLCGHFSFDAVEEIFEKFAPA